MCAFDRAKMLTGANAGQQCFETGAKGTFLPATLDGPTPPPSGEPEWFVGITPPGTANALDYYKFHVDWNNAANTTLTGPTTLPVSPYSEACGGGSCIPQTGTKQKLDSLGDRLMYRLAYRNFGDHEAMVVSHAISATAGSSNTVGMRWYELRPSGCPTACTLPSASNPYQQGTYAPDSTYRWMGSIAMDRAGDMGLGYSTSSSSAHPQIAYTGRLAGDAAGTMQTEANLCAAVTPSNPCVGSQNGGLNRWGDYSEMSVDPSDDCTFWYVNEYIPSNGSFNWHTRIGSFKFSGCGANDFSISASPSSVSASQGKSVSTTVNTAVTSGATQSVSLSASGLPSGATASFNPSSVNAGNASTLTLTTATSTPIGTYPVTITGTGPSGSHSTTVSLTVSSAYRDAVLGTSGLVSYWRLGEQSGTTAVDSKGTNNGTYGGGYLLGQPGALAHDPDTAAWFDGGSGQVSLPNSLTLPLNSQVTVEFWAYISSSDVGNYSAFTIGGLGDPNRAQAHVPWSDGVLYWDYGSTATGRISTSYTSYMNKWTHVALVSEGRGGHFQGIYLNGQLVASQPSSDGPTQAVSGGSIAAWPSCGCWLRGRIDEFALYNTALPASTIQQHYQAAGS
jgi:hypothetical protein